MSIPVLVTIKNGVVDGATVFSDESALEAAFVAENRQYGRETNDAEMDDGYVELEDVTICMAWADDQTRMKSLKQLANEAIFVQDACNGVAVVKAYGKMVSDLRNALAEAGESNDTDALRNHPINRLWASKIHDLAGMGLSDMDRYAKAYKWCVDMTSEE